MKIVFLDIDGPMIPYRAHALKGQTLIFSLFDPCAVGLLNKLCSLGPKIVVQSTWRKSAFAPCEDVRQHLIDQGILEEYLHEDWSCPYKFTSSRWDEIGFWLNDHPEITEYVILDDALPTERFAPKTVEIDYNEGFLYSNFIQAKTILKLYEEPNVIKITRS